MERLPLVTTNATLRVGRVVPVGSRSSVASTTPRNWAHTWLMTGVTAGIAIVGGLTVFASAQIMTASHQLAMLQQQESEIQQSLRYLQTEYAEVSSLERVEAYAEQAGLVNTVSFAGTVQNTLPVAQRTR